MSTLATWDKIIGSLGSTDITFGGDWGNLISDFMNGVDIALSDPTKQPRPNTLTRWKHEKFGLFDGDESHHVLFSVNDIDTGATRKIVIKRMIAPFETDNMVLEGLAQPLLNKQIDFDLNTGTNIDNDNIKASAGIVTSKLADGSNFALKNAANTFTAVQTIQVDSTFPLTLYRANPGANTSNVLVFSGQNSAGTKKDFAQINVQGSDVTVGAERGTFRLFMMQAGAINEMLNLTNNLLTVGISPTKYILDPVGLTTTRTYTFPNYNGEFRAFGVTSVQHKEGWADCVGRIVGHGLLEPIQVYYSTSSPSQSLQGTTTSLFTGTVPNTAAGIAVILAQGVTRRSWNPYGFFRASLSMSSADAIFMYGFTSRVGLLPASNTPLSTTESGVLIGFRSTDTEFKVFYNDGAGGDMSVASLSPSVAIPSSTTMLSFEIKMTSAGILCTIYNSGVAVLGSVLLTSGALPATTTNLNYQGLIFNPTGVDKAFSITKINIRSEK